MSNPAVTFRFPVAQAVSWTLALGLPVAGIGGVSAYMGNPKLDLLPLMGGLLAVVVIVALLAVLALRAFPFTISPHGIRGWAPRTIRGVVVPWDAIRDTKRAVFGDVPCLSIQGKDSKNSCLVPIVIARRAEFKATVEQFTGPTHCFVHALKDLT